MMIDDNVFPWIESSGSNKFNKKFVRVLFENGF